MIDQNSPGGRWWPSWYSMKVTREEKEIRELQENKDKSGDLRERGR